MSDRPDRLINRLILPVGFAIILFFASIVIYKSNSNSLIKLEGNARIYFESMKKYKKPVALPSIKLLNPRGKIVNIRDFRGHFLILNIWATWCAPCLKEMPELSKLQRHYPRGDYRVIAVSVDSRKNIDSIVKYVEKYKLGDMAGYHDYNSELQKALPIRKLPVTYIINSKGKIIYKVTGAAKWSSPDIIDFLDMVIAVY